jgi:hypothetical protein
MARHGEDAAGAGDGKVDQGFAKLRWHTVSVFYCVGVVRMRTALPGQAFSTASGSLPLLLFHGCTC